MLHRKGTNTAIDGTEVREARSKEVVLLVGMEIAMGVLAWMMEISERVIHPAMVSV
jgi:magnesium-transporting ATPase (P-type)